MEKEKRGMLKPAMKMIKERVEACIYAETIVDVERIVSDAIIIILDEWKRAYYGNRLEPQDPQSFQAMFEETKLMRPDLVRTTRELVQKSTKIHSKAKTVVGTLLEEAGYTDYRILIRGEKIELTVEIGKILIVLPIKLSAISSACEKIVPTIKAVEKLKADLSADFGKGAVIELNT